MSNFVPVTSTRTILGVTVSRTTTMVEYPDVAPEAAWESAVANLPITPRHHMGCIVCYDLAVVEGTSYCARDLPAHVKAWEDALAERAINRGGSWN